MNTLNDIIFSICFENENCNKYDIQFLLQNIFYSDFNF